jgi:hypothetical protein
MWLKPIVTVESTATISMKNRETQRTVTVTILDRCDRKRYNIQDIILPVVLYGYETWSLTLREEHRLKVFENRVLRRIFGPKRDEVTDG